MARRIIAVSPDEAFSRELAALTVPDTTVEVHRGATFEGEVSLWVIHDTAALPPGQAPVVAIAPNAPLASVVDQMAGSDRVVATLVAYDQAKLAAIAERALGGELFGLEHVIAVKRPHEITIRDHDDKVRAIGEVLGFLEKSRIATTLIEPIEQCIDEMLMNALYAAPVDADGARVFAGVPTRKRIMQQTEQAVTLQYASDGRRFAVAVRDAFGSLDRAALLRFLHKGLHAEDKVDRKAGGAGLGLYLMVQAATAAYFHVVPGVACEVICVFDLGAPRVLESLSFHTRPRAAGQRATPPAHASLSPAARRHRTAVLVGGVAPGAVVAIALIAAIVGDAAPASEVTIATTDGATVDLDRRVVGVADHGTLTLRDLAVGGSYAVAARKDGFANKHAIVHPRAMPTHVDLALEAVPTLELDSQPTDAAVMLDGKSAGTTPLVLTSLAAGSTVAIAITKRGYRTAAATLTIPARGAATRHIQTLLRDDLARVRITSNPPGAEITGPGITDRTYAPAEIFVEPATPQRFTLAMPKHAPVVIEVTAARGDDLVKNGDLAPL